MQTNLAQILEEAIKLENADRIYTVDFDEVWALLGYPNRGNAARCLIANLIQNVDFVSVKDCEAIKNWKSKAPLQKIWLTVEGYLLFALLAKSEQGRGLRRYYLDKKQGLTASLEKIYEAS